ncbi:BRO-N domain-containing protein [Phascolarctobacterium succinatutens]|uniref:BRO-N domain-containing protein n=1 Tax=Phascolarctobacterium succinatutens TaxID=626940 RepID=UPI0026744239|nr:Bro-N domain-containing protein [Phascolarctobacterium succinatutens]
MNNLQIFNSPEFGQVRTIQQNGEPWFVGKDVAEILGYKDTSDAMKKHVDIEDKLTRRFADSGQNREMYIINESGLYSLILSSKMPKAKEFKRWVTSEVIPAIRKTGKYEAMAQAVPINDEPATDFTQLEFDQRIRIAAIIASCRRERLQLVAKVLSLDLEGMMPLMPAHITEAEQAAYQYISSVYDSLERDTPIQYFYTAYTKWCMEQNLLPLTKHGVTKVLKKYFPVQTVATAYYENGTRVMGCCRCYRKMGR